MCEMTHAELFGIWTDMNRKKRMCTMYVSMVYHNEPKSV